MDAIVCHDLTRRFPQAHITIGPVDLIVPSGTVFGLVGPSGCGKTTLVRLMAGLLTPSRGHVEVLGLGSHDHRLRRRVGYMAQADALYPELSAVEHLRFFGAAYGLHGKGLALRVDELLSRTGLEKAGLRAVREYSGGMRRRLSLAIALLPSPSLLLLDEPTIGLDPLLRRDLWAWFTDLSRAGTTILLTTHAMDEAARCARIAFLREGSLLTADAPQEVLRRTRTQSLDDAFIALAEREAV